MFPRARVLLATSIALVCLGAASQDTGVSAKAPKFTSDYEVKFDPGKVLVRKKGTSKWMEGLKVVEPVAIGIIGSDQKIYVVTKAIQPPKPKAHPAPELPYRHGASSEQEEVSVRIVVDDKGIVRLCKVESSSDLSLNDWALAAVAKWTFEPAKLNSEPVAAMIVVHLGYTVLPQ